MSIGTITIHRDIELHGELHSFALQSFSEEDIPKFKKYWDAWKYMQAICADAHNRAPNLAEYFTEGLVALMTGTSRRVSNNYAKANDPSVRFTQKGRKSGDNFNLTTKESSEVKSTILPFDCTQLSPNNHLIEIFYFIHFFNDGELDGTFSIYEFSPELTKSIIVCKEKNETTADQNKQGRRAKICLMQDVIIANDISPIHSRVKLW